MKNNFNDKRSKDFIKELFSKSNIESREFKSDYSPFDLLLIKENKKCLVEIKRIINKDLDINRIMIEKIKIDEAKKLIEKNDSINGVYFTYLYTTIDKDSRGYWINESEEYNKLLIFHYKKKEILNMDDFIEIESWKDSNKLERVIKIGKFLEINKIIKEIKF